MSSKEPKEPDTKPSTDPVPPKAGAPTTPSGHPDGKAPDATPSEPQADATAEGVEADKNAPDKVESPVETIVLPEDKLAELEVIFGKFDLEGDALPLSEELENMVRLMGYDPDWKELRYLQRKLKGMDRMQFEQFVKIMVEEEKRVDRKTRGHAEEEILAIFKRWDTEGTGLISRDTFVTNMMTRGDPLEENEMELMMREMLGDEDVGEGDMIEYEPFVRRMFEKLEEAEEKRMVEVENFMEEKARKAEEEMKRADETNNTSGVPSSEQGANQ